MENLIENCTIYNEYYSLHIFWKTLMQNLVIGLFHATPIRMPHCLKSANQNAAFLKMPNSDWRRIEKSERWVLHKRLPE